MSNGTLTTMRTTIDAAGRVVIPKAIRDRLALRGGEQIEVSENDGVIEIARPKRDGPLVRTKHGNLTMPDGPTLGPDEVRDLIERDREERMSRW